MMEVSAARETVLRFAEPLPAQITPLSSPALGQVLAVDVASDVDSPPFAKALMDGYAVRAADLAGGPVALKLVGEVAAGAMPTVAVGPGEAVTVYTGAPLPDGADAVVVKERCEATGGTVTATDTALTPGKNILARAAEMRAGDVVIPTGTVLTPTAYGLLAAVGKTAVMAIPRPRLVVVATGNELVEPAMKPRGGQIRNTNGPMLMAQAASAGALPRYLGVCPDDADTMASYVREGLEIADVLVFAGGVSAGKFDLVPEVLKAHGVEIHLHHVRMKPGKPLLFGTKGKTLVFGLPGNPVSAFVGFELFVRPALRALGGHKHPGPRERRYPLSEPLTARHDRPTYHPARIDFAAGVVHPLPWFGSADLRALLGANALIALPAGEVNFEAGAVVKVLFTHG